MIIPEVGNWSDHKYALLANYCGIFTGGMQGKWNLVYIDLFAGAGYARIRETGSITRTSALLALTTKKPYDVYLINELDSERYSALVQRCQRHADGRSYKTFNLDANAGAEEIADVAILLTYLAHDLNVDMEEAVRRKLVKNAAKYPVEKARGVATKWDRL